MFTAIKFLWSSVNPNSAKIEYEKQLDRELAILNENEIEQSTVCNIKEDLNENKIEDLKHNECFRRIGVITSMKSNHGVIDYSHLFDLFVVNSTLDTLREGYRVEYVGYNKSNSDCIKIVKIEKIIGDYWDENIPEQQLEEEVSALKEQVPEYFTVHQRSILGIIINKNENFITVDTDYSQIPIELEKISLEFMPQVGDRVYLNCKVQTDISFVNSVGEILDILNIYPARSKKIKFAITEIHKDECWGVIDDDYFFTTDILPIDYSPNQGDFVEADAIESDVITNQKTYNWRCIKIVLIEKSISFLLPKLNKKDESDLFLDKNDMVITNNIQFSFDRLYQENDFEIIVTNDAEKTQKVVKCVFLGKKSESQLCLIEPNMNDSFLIQPKESRIFRLRGKAKVYGISTEIFVINFVGFRIGRKISIEVGSIDDNRHNANTTKNSNYQRNPTQNRLHALDVWSKKYNLVHGERLIQPPKFIANRIGCFAVPDKLKKIILSSKTKFEKTEHLEDVYPILKEKLSIFNYVYKFQLLLYLEEIEYFQSMRKYDRERAHFSREKEYLALEIENLAEKRPSLMIGDTVRASNPWIEKNSNNCYEGVIYKVLYNRILVKFCSSFNDNYNGEDYKLEFFYSRLNFRKQHYAIKKGFYHIGKEILFPCKIQINSNLQLNVTLHDDNENLILHDIDKTVEWFNTKLNLFQKIAVTNILRGEARPMPYLIFGPPGTGKTLTLIETILQLTALVSNSRLLVGTSSNSSADLIATRLIASQALQPGDFIRLVSHNLIEKELIPDHLKPFCATIDIAEERTGPDSMIITESGLKLKCRMKHLGHHRIIIGTCTTLGTLLQLGFPKGHFSHFLVDEAGQCTEPEIMIGISQIDNFSGQIILAGDPLQLGPVILDKYAAMSGLETSLMVRLLQCIPYMKDKERFSDSQSYDPRLVTKLIYNYRSVPSILKIFNDLFYDSDLKAEINEIDSREITILKNLQDILHESETRSPHHGVFFVGIRGENRQDPDSPSWYNAAEARSVFLFLLKLYKKQIDAKNIGIVTPYQKQVRMIRNILMEAEMVLPKIGSVEEFQGQERDIILISTVRSTKSELSIDLIHALGFVQSKKRMNVAISRARSLLVIFGNPHLLILDSSWEKLIKYCINNDAYIGCDLPLELYE